MGVYFSGGVGGSVVYFCLFLNKYIEKRIRESIQ